MTTNRTAAYDKLAGRTLRGIGLQDAPTDDNALALWLDMVTIHPDVYRHWLARYAHHPDAGTAILDAMLRLRPVYDLCPDPVYVAVMRDVADVLRDGAFYRAGNLLTVPPDPDDRQTGWAARYARYAQDQAQEFAWANTLQPWHDLPGRIVDPFRDWLAIELWASDRAGYLAAHEAGLRQHNQHTYEPYKSELQQAREIVAFRDAIDADRETL